MEIVTLVKVKTIDPIVIVPLVVFSDVEKARRWMKHHKSTWKPHKLILEPLLIDPPLEWEGKGEKTCQTF